MGQATDRQTGLPDQTPPDFLSDHLAIGFSRGLSAVSYFSMDSLGLGNLKNSPVDENARQERSLKFAVDTPGEFQYLIKTPDGGELPAWKIHCSGKTVRFSSIHIPGTTMPDFVFRFDQKSNHATLLGLMRSGGRSVSLPAILHLPDLGSARITGHPADLLLNYDARRHVERPFVQVSLPAASAEHPQVEYQMEVVAIHPQLPAFLATLEVGNN